MSLSSAFPAVVVATDHIDQNVLRATLMRTTLRGFGIFWRSKGNYRDKAALWKCSFKCDRIRFFLSHSWAASGTYKYVTLLLKSGVWVAGVVAMVLLLGFFVTTTLGLLPVLGVYKVTIFGVDYVPPLSLWCSTLPPIFALVVLLASLWLRLPSQSMCSTHRKTCLRLVSGPGFSLNALVLLLSSEP